jgi:hypothetical protein
MAKVPAFGPSSPETERNSAYSKDLDPSPGRSSTMSPMRRLSAGALGGGASSLTPCGTIGKRTGGRWRRINGGALHHRLARRRLADRGLIARAIRSPAQ